MIGWAVVDARAAHFLPHGRHMTVETKVAYFKRSVAHDRQVIRWFLSPHAPRTLQRVTELGWYLRALTWHRHLLAQYTAKLLPDPRTYAGECLAAIIDHEGSGWNPLKWNRGYVGVWDSVSTHGGSGAYGLPQALPGDKMKSAGADWATNVYTQIRWAHSYATTRYGSDCSAWAWWQSQRSW